VKYIRLSCAGVRLTAGVKLNSPVEGPVTAEPKIDMITNSQKLIERTIALTDKIGISSAEGRSPKASHPACMIDPAILSLE